MRAGLDQNLALKHAHCAVLQHFLEHLTAFAALPGVGDKHRIIMVKIPIPHAGSGNMGRRIIAQKLDIGVVAGQPTIGGQGKGFEQCSLGDACENMGRGAALMIAALSAHMVKARAFGHVHL